MTFTVQQSRILTGVVWLLSACLTLAMVWENPIPLLAGPVLGFFGALAWARAAKAPLPAQLLVGTICTYVVLMAGCFFLTAKTTNTYPMLATLVSVASWVCAYLLGRFMRQNQVPPAGNMTGPTATTPHAVGEGHMPTLSDPLSKQLVGWVEQYFPIPLSRKYAAIAAAMRALEQGKTGEQARQAAEQAAHAWAPPAGVALRFIDSLTTQGPWKDIPYQVLSQGLAIEAAVLRALELGQDDATAVAAGKKMGKAWAPPAGQQAATST